MQKQDISIGGTRSTVETDEVVVGAPSIRSHRHIPYSESLPQFPFFHDETAVPDTRPVPPTPFDQNPILPDQDNALTQGSVEVDNWSIISVVGDNAPVDDPDSWPETDAEYGSCESLRDSLEEALEQTDGSEVEDYDSSPSAMYDSTVPAARL